jgi:purine-binding chemotaxis protein CheW
MAPTSSKATNKTVETESTGPAHKTLSFGLGKEEYGLDILVVREIIGIIDITPLPRTPDYVKGVINLRGKIIPVIELRQRFGMPTVEYTDETCIIVVDVPVDGEGEGESRLMGVVVDTVREVLDIPAAAIEPPPEFGCNVPIDYITGIGRIKGTVVVLLDTSKVMNPPAANAVLAATKGLAPGSGSAAA